MSVMKLVHVLILGLCSTAHATWSPTAYWYNNVHPSVSLVDPNEAYVGGLWVETSLTMPMIFAIDQQGSTIGAGSPTVQNLTSLGQPVRMTGATKLKANQAFGLVPNATTSNVSLVCINMTSFAWNAIPVGNEFLDILYEPNGDKIYMLAASVSTGKFVIYSSIPSAGCALTAPAFVATSSAAASPASAYISGTFTWLVTSTKLSYCITDGPTVTTVKLYIQTIGGAETISTLPGSMVTNPPVGAVGVSATQVLLFTASGGGSTTTIQPVTVATGAFTGSSVVINGTFVSGSARCSNSTGLVYFATDILELNDLYMNVYDPVVGNASAFDADIPNVPSAGKLMLFGDISPGRALLPTTASTIVWSGTTSTINFAANTWMIPTRDLVFDFTSNYYPTNPTFRGTLAPAYTLGGATAFSISVPNVPSWYHGVYTATANLVDSTNAFRTPQFQACIQANHTTYHTMGFDGDDNHFNPYAISWSFGDYERIRIAPHVATFPFGGNASNVLSVAFDRANLTYYGVSTDYQLTSINFLTKTQVNCTLAPNIRLQQIVVVRSVLYGVGNDINNSSDALFMWRIYTSGSACGPVLYTQPLTNYTNYTVLHPRTLSGADTTPGGNPVVSMIVSITAGPLVWININVLAASNWLINNTFALASTAVIGAAIHPTSGAMYGFERNINGLTIGQYALVSGTYKINPATSLNYLGSIIVALTSRPFFAVDSLRLHWQAQKLVGGVNVSTVFVASMAYPIAAEFVVNSTFKLVSDMTYARLSGPTPVTDYHPSHGGVNVTFATGSYVIETTAMNFNWRLQNFVNQTDLITQDCGNNITFTTYKVPSWNFTVPNAPKFKTPAVETLDIGCFDLMLSMTATSSSDRNHTKDFGDFCVTATHTQSVTRTPSLLWPCIELPLAVVGQPLTVRMCKPPLYSTNKLRLTRMPDCSSDGSFVDQVWTTTNQTLTFGTAWEASSALPTFLCWAPMGTGVYEPLDSFFIQDAPTYSAASSTIVNQTFNLTLGHLGTDCPFKPTDEGLSYRKMSFVLASDVACNHTIAATLRNWTTGCNVSMSVTATSAMFGNVYVCFSSGGIYRPIHYEEPPHYDNYYAAISVVNPPRFMAPPLMAGVAARVSMVGLLKMFAGLQVMITNVSNPTCTSPTPAYGTTTQTWSVGSPSVTFTPTMNRRTGDFQLCFSANNGISWAPIYPKDKNRHIYRCQLSRLPAAYCWCMSDHDSGRVHSDCRTYYSEPWFNGTSPSSIAEWQALRSQWNEFSFDFSTEKLRTIVL